MRNRHHLCFTRRNWDSQRHTAEMRHHPKLIIPTETTAHNALHEMVTAPPRPDRVLAGFCLDVLGSRNEANRWDTRFDGTEELIGQLLRESEDEPSPRRAKTMYQLAKSFGRQIIILGRE